MEGPIGVRRVDSKAIVVRVKAARRDVEAVRTRMILTGAAARVDGAADAGEAADDAPSFDLRLNDAIAGAAISWRAARVDAA